MLWSKENSGLKKEIYMTVDLITVSFFELEIQDCYKFWRKKKEKKIATYQLWLQKEIYMIVDFITVSIKLQAPIYVGIV